MEGLAKAKKEIIKLHTELGEKSRLYKKNFDQEYNRRTKEKEACSEIVVKEFDATITRNISGLFICKFSCEMQYEFQDNIRTRIRDGYELRICNTDNVGIAWYLHVKDGIIQDRGVEKEQIHIDRVKELYPKLEELRARFPPYSRYTILAEMEEDIMKELNKI